MRVKGKAKSVRIFTLAGDAAYASSEGFVKLARLHANMIGAFRVRRFDSARKSAEEAQESAPAALKEFYRYMKTRCDAFIADPPPKDWDGVTEFDHK